MPHHRIYSRLFQARSHYSGLVRWFAVALLLTCVLLTPAAALAAPPAEPFAAPAAQGQTVERWVDGFFGSNTMKNDDDDDIPSNCTRLVQPGEEEGDPDVYVYHSCRTISYALSIANPGDVIRVVGGTTYVGNLLVREKMTIMGGYAPGFGAQIEPPQFPDIFPTVVQGAVIVVGTAQGLTPPQITGEGPMEVRLETLQVTSGGIDIASGNVFDEFPPRVANSVNVDLENVVVRNSTDSNGGGIKITGSNNKLTVANTLIQNNSATNGGGLYADGGSIVNLGENTIIRNNSATNGGGIAVSGALTITASSGVTITANIASSNGGGVYANATFVNLGSDTAIFNNNAANGGGVYLNFGNNTISGALINSNRANNQGGGVYVNGGAPLLENLEINQNVAGTGGGLYLTGLSGGSLSSMDVFTNTAFANHGGGYYLNSSNSVSVSSLTVQGNRAVTDGGGAYIANVNNSSVTGHTFTGNVADSNNDTIGAGGGIYLVGGAVTLQSNIYTGNHGDAGGGLLINASNGTTTSSDSFSQNSARFGAAIYLVANNGTRISGPQITGNNATVQGGGVYATSNPNITLGGTTLLGNTSNGEGAGIYAVGSTLVFTSSTLIDGNISQNRGGGAFLGAGALLTFESLDLQNNQAREGGGFYADGGRAITTGATSFITNIATNGAGGALYLRGNGSTTTQIDNLFAQGNESTRGGALFADGVVLNLGTISLSGNEAVGGQGGAAYFNNSKVTVTGSATLMDNAADQDGGGIYAATTSFDFRMGVNFNGNEAKGGRGGGIYLTGNGQAAKLGVATFFENEAALDGGGIYAERVAVSVAATTVFDSNLAQAGSGGGFFVRDAALMLGGVTLKSNRAFVTGGGGILTKGDLSVFADTVLNENRAQTGNGGGLAVVDSAKVLVDDALFTKNEANGDGGGLHMVNSTSTVQNGATFSENSASNGRGGAIFVSGGRATLTAVTLSKNLGGNGGGALHITTDVLNLTNSTLSENNGSAGFGGGAYVKAKTATLTNSTFDKNVAAQGAGLYVAETGDARLNTLQLTDNNSSAAGGALFISLSVARLNGLFVRGNQADSEGGGLYAQFSRVIANNSLIVNNRVIAVANYGAGIYLSNSRLEMTHGTIANNSHTQLQGTSHGIYVAPPVAAQGGFNRSDVVLVNTIVSGQAVGVNLLAGNTANFNAVLWNNSSFDWTGAGSFTVARSRRGDPRFTNVATNDYHILRDSAAFDRGVSSNVAVDRDGVARTQGLAPDLGAYEHRYNAGLYLTSSISPAFVNPGDELTIRLRIRNQSASQADGVVLSALLATDLPSPTITSSNGAEGSCQGIFCEVPLGSLSTGADVTVEIKVIVAGTPSPAGLINLLTNVTLATSNFATSDTTASVSAYLQSCRVQLKGQPFATVQAALNAAAKGDTIRISGACGAFHQNGGPGQLLTINKDVTLQGGWDSTFTTLDPAAFPTFLDSSGLGRVVYINGNFAPVLENLILRNGNATSLGGGPAGKDAGGGLYVNGGAPLLRNVDIASNQSPDLGAGVYIAGPRVATFEGGFVRNNGAGERGGGLYIEQSAPVLKGVTISGNTARGGGGAYLHRSAAQFLDTAANGGVPTCRIDGNSTSIMPNYVPGTGAGGLPVLWLAPGGGGGIVLDESAATLRGCAINGNTARVGGGLYIHNSAAVLENNLITLNRAQQPNPNAILTGPGGVRDGDGGGIVLDNQDPTVITLRGLFLGDNSALRGSALFTRLARGDVLPLPHFTINRNSGGNAVFALGESRLTFNDTIIAANTGGPAVFAQAGSNGEAAAITLDRTLWNPPTQIKTGSNGGATVTPVNDFNGDPAFKNDGYHLKRISFAYDVGTANVDFADRDGQARPIGENAELGADEYATAITVRYVAVGGSGSAPCTDYRAPCALLQMALDAANDGDLIKMAGGTYNGVRNDDGRVHHARIEKSVVIQGGYFPRTDNNIVTEGIHTQNDWEDPHPVENPTIIDVGDQGRVFFITGNVTPTISFLTLRRGNAITLSDGPAGGSGGGGGAIYVDGATPIFENVIVEDSRANYGSGFYLRNAGGNYKGVTVVENGSGVSNGKGGAFYIEGGQPTLQNMTIQSNVAVTGAAIYLDNTAATLRQNTIQSNGDATTLDGGGIYDTGGGATIISNTVASNQAQHGGGLYLANSNATLRGNIIDNNHAGINPPPTTQLDALGAGLYVVGGAPLVTGNTISNNQAIHPALSLGGGLYLAQTEVNLTGNTITGNQAHRGAGLYFAATVDIVVQDNTISNNLAQSPDETLRAAGGGVYFSSAVISFTHNSIAQNSAVFGAGLYVAGLGHTQLGQNTLTGNVSSKDGGGVYLDGSDAELEANILQENRTTGGRGGGLYASNGQAALRANSFIANLSALEGGGIFLNQDASTLHADVIQGNQSGDGGGIYIEGPPAGAIEPAAWLDQVTIVENIAGNQGGGLFMRNSGAQVTLSVIRDNDASVNGGGAVIQNSTPAAFSSNLIRSNQAGDQGGGLYISRSSAGRYQSNAIVDNIAGEGGGIYVAGSSPILVHTTLARNGSGLVATGQDQIQANVVLSNTLVANHAQFGVKADFGSSIAMYATLWEANSQKAVVTNNNFTSSGDIDGTANFADDGYHLTNTSGALSKGLINDVAVGNDVDNEGRFQGSGPDLGADELTAECSIFVAGQPTLHSLQEAIDKVATGGEVLLAGSCSTMSTVGGTTQLGYIVDKNITIRGGYADGSWDVSSPQTQPSVLDAGGQGRGIRVASGVRVTLANLTLVNGSAAGQGGGPGGVDAGGNIYVDDGQVTLTGVDVINGQATIGGGLFLRAPVASVTNSNFRANLADSSGGGIYLDTAPTSVEIRNNRFANNRAADGAAIYALAGTPLLISNHFQDNQTDGGSGHGGALYLAGSNAVLNRNRIENNRAGLGGALYVAGGIPNLTNNLLVRNVGIAEAGALYGIGSPLHLRNNTLVANSTIQSGGSALFFATPSSNVALTMTNNILVDHILAVHVESGNQLSTRANLWNNNQTNWLGAVNEGPGNISGNPLFANPALGNYRLLEGSPAVDQGVNVGVNDDIDGQNRPARQGYDIGADEFLLPTISASLAALPNPVASGGEQTYVLQVNNTGDLEVVARVQITLPAVLTPNGQTVWEDVDIARGSIWEESLTATLDENYTGNLDAVMTVSTDEGASATSSVATSAAPVAGAILEFSGESAPNPARPGGDVELRLNVTNRGAVDVDAVIEVQLPDGLSTSSALVFTRTIDGPDGNFSTSIKATVDPDVPAENETGGVNRLLTTVLVSSNRDTSESFTIATDVADPSVQVTRIPSPNPAIAGKSLSYNIFVTNTGNVALATTISNTFPAQVALVDITQAQPVEVVLPPGEVWQAQISATVEAGYVGPLSGAVFVTTDAEVSATDVDEINARRQTLKPDATAKGGDWFDPNSWEPPGVPAADAIVLIPEGILIYSEQPLTVAGLINHGTLEMRSADGVSASQAMTVTSILENYGEIRGRDGVEGGLPGQPGAIGETGLTLNMTSAILYNEGTIRAGNGAPDGNDGGDLIITAGATTNLGIFAAGNGGGVNDADADVQGGQGGDILLSFDPGLFTNSGTVEAGEGGDSHPDADPPQPGGNGGGVTIVATSAIRLDNGDVFAGQGGSGSTGSTSGLLGAVVVGAPMVSHEGTTFSEGTVLVFRQSDNTYNFTAIGPDTVALSPLTGLAIFTIRIFNRGPLPDTYVLTPLAVPAGWQVINLPSTMNLSAFRSNLVFVILSVSVDQITGAAEQPLSIVVTSQRDAGNQVLVPLQVITVNEAEPFRIQLPQISR